MYSGVVAAEEAAGHVARRIQTVDHLVVGVKHLAVLVDAQTIERGQHRPAEPATVERRRAQRGQTVGLFAEVVVLLRIELRVVTFHLVEEGPLGLALEAQLVCQLF